MKHHYDSQVVTGGAGTTTDSLFDGALLCHQHRDGYRFSLDAVLLAHFSAMQVNCRILDLGCGCGIISLILLYRWQARNIQVTGIERQTGLYALAEKNRISNRGTDRFRIIRGDIRSIKKMLTPESVDAVFCNPPFYQTGRGRMNDGLEIREARHQLHGSLADFLQAAYYAVRNGGELNLIYPAQNLAELTVLASQTRLPIKRLQCVYSYPQKGLAARLVLVKCRKNGNKGMEVMEPFYVYKHRGGPYTDQMQQLYDS